MDGVMGDGDPLFRAAHLQLDHWNNIPANSGFRYSYNCEATRERREIVCYKIIPLLMRLMSEHLTARQFEVVRLCYLDYNYTQKVAAQILGITQPTVSQHLKGKRRSGKNVGGAFRRIRRRLSKITEIEDINTDETRILHFLESLVRKDMSYRRRQRLFNSLQ
jgi:predicted transcriptional regulator